MYKGRRNNGTVVLHSSRPMFSHGTSPVLDRWLLIEWRQPISNAFSVLPSPPRSELRGGCVLEEPQRFSRRESLAESGLLHSFAFTRCPWYVCENNLRERLFRHAQKACSTVVSTTIPVKKDSTRVYPRVGDLSLLKIHRMSCATQVWHVADAPQPEEGRVKCDPAQGLCHSLWSRLLFKLLKENGSILQVRIQPVSTTTRGSGMCGAQHERID